MKSPNLWISGSSGTDNSSGFTALPGGYRLGGSGEFEYIGKKGEWLSSTMNSVGGAWGYWLHYDYSELDRLDGGRYSAFSIRCVKD